MALKKAIREKIHQKYEKHCAYCGDNIEYKDMQVDHIIPQANFKSQVKTQKAHPDVWLTQIPKFLFHLKENEVNHIDNLNPSCRVCNKFKDTYSLKMFKMQLESQLFRANKYSSNFRMALKYNQVVETPKTIVFYFELLNL